MQKATFLFVLLAVAFQTAMAQTPKIKMTIQEIITRPGVWEANPEASFRYQEELLHQKGLEEAQADKIIAKTTGAFFMFRDNKYWHYAETPFGRAILAKFFFKVIEGESFDEFDLDNENAIKIYKEATFEGEPVLTFSVRSMSEERIIFYLEEERMYFVCDYTTDKKKFPEE